MDEIMFFKAVRLARMGNKAEAKEMLLHVLSSDPSSEMAWLWYADCAATYEERMQILEMGLRHNPKMPRVFAGLRALQRGKAADMGRTQPVYTGKVSQPSNKASRAPFFGLEEDDNFTKAENLSLGEPFPFSVGEDALVERSWEYSAAHVFTVAPDHVTPEEFEEIEKRTLSSLLKRTAQRSPLPALSGA